VFVLYPYEHTLAITTQSLRTLQARQALQSAACARLDRIRRDQVKVARVGQRQGELHKSEGVLPVLSIRDSDRSVWMS
jgi:hypothetical protein